MTHTEDDPSGIAIIGLACRFPGTDGPRDFWQLLRDGREAPKSFGDAVADFDADLFNISPREACAMDPRQRLALELTWELFEDAFIMPRVVSGQQVAVFLGAMNDDYAFLTLSATASSVDHHSFPGTSRALIANRVSYAFGLQGPSLTVDSGQSSSLVAVHLAAETLRTGAAPLAVAGGIHLNLANEIAVLEMEFGAVSRSGQTYAFDERADGYVRGEGAGLILLKPLRTALADGNRIHAVIRGSAAGNAGHSTAALTAPSVSGEAEVIQRALAAAGLDGHDIDYVEAHGTGTAIGDPAEVLALGEVFGERRRGPVRVGSVKTNVGHTGGAAGVAGLIKTVLAIENAEIPASLNYGASPPGADLASRGLQVNTCLAPWPDTPRRAGVSSFGMGGTNAHLILEQAPVLNDAVPEVDSGLPVPWVLSARSVEALQIQARRLLSWVSTDSGLRATDVGWSLATTRTPLEHRAVVIGTDRVELIDRLRALAVGTTGMTSGRTAFVFPGQGSQYLGMGQQLYQRFPAFARTFNEVASALDEHLRLPLRQVIWGRDGALLESTEFAQPALFTVEVALAALLASWGVVADVVLGHSVGEIAAAHVAGVLTLSDAARVVAVRGRLMSALPSGGVMVAVAAGEDEVTPLLVDGVTIAAVNAPDAVVISGLDTAVAAVVDPLVARGRRAHRLAVSHAFHSELMEPMLTEFSRAVAGVSASSPRIQLLSNITGQLAGPGYGSGGYWAEHVRRPVRFVESLRVAESLGADIFMEVGPAAGLTTAFAPLTRDRPEVESLLDAVAELFAAGVAVDWRGAFDGLSTRRVDLPTYGFARQRFWLGAAVQPPAHQGAVPFPERLRQLDAKERHRRLVELICEHAAIVLGHDSGRDVDAQRAFQDLGFESMTGVELRNRLIALTGLSLSRTLIFDYPTAEKLAEHLGRQLSADPCDESHDETDDQIDDETDDETVRRLLRTIPIAELRRAGLLDRLLLLTGHAKTSSSQDLLGEDAIDSLSPEALIALALDTADRKDTEN
ncbi:type I polyketide synthase [Mycobacterium asiaticum]|uniref:Polyketide synthase n=1 Tax=Mycobacterium asiaticum TaxID=1790 RepID=A0A1A3NEQ0_MYCAS|nr:type I polyketide synthase [Mycobacterium asiaticum]OBK18877.1 polyketide synthase [Mycobacterium asiaticum]